MNLTERNKLPYEVPSFLKDMADYRHNASDNCRKRQSRTRVGKVKHSRKDAKPVLPEADYCAYTGIRFADASGGICNPNDPLKRSIDHMKPLVLCYAEGWTIDEANHPDNLCWVLKCINTVRGCSELTSFKPLADWYRSELIEQGHEYTDETIFDSLS